MNITLSVLHSEQLQLYATLRTGGMHTGGSHADWLHLLQDG